MPMVSLIVPVLADAESASLLLADSDPDPRVEIVLVDGGNDERLDRITASRSDVHLMRSSRGRARQMNAGARLASGEWLLFLHADSRLPPHWISAFERAHSQTVGGWFRFGIDDPAWQARIIELGVRWRVRLWRLPYGDQGLFVRRATFEQMGGYRDLPLMEDVDFIGRLKAAGQVVEVPHTLLTSARRWRNDGWFRRSMRNLALVSLYFAGVPPARLARWYSRK